MNRIFSLLFLLAPATVLADVNVVNTTDIQDLSPREVTFQGGDNCTYYGNTQHRDARNGVQVTRKQCAGHAELISARAYLIELKPAESPVPLVPTGSGWILKSESDHNQSPREPH